MLGVAPSQKGGRGVCAALCLREGGRLVRTSWGGLSRPELVLVQLHSECKTRERRLHQNIFLYDEVKICKGPLVGDHVTNFDDTVLCKVHEFQFSGLAKLLSNRNKASSPDLTHPASTEENAGCIFIETAG